MKSYSPLSLEQLCITTILSLVWNDHFDSMEGISSFLLDYPIFREKFKHRHDVMKWCLLAER